MGPTLILSPCFASFFFSSRRRHTRFDCDWSSDVCSSDPGYGKTEVALRGAFKATQDGKQVAVLVPTTVLAAQHHATFSARFAAFPIRVAILSRFVPANEQERALAGLTDGSVDIGIGTHRLLPTGVRV